MRHSSGHREVYEIVVVDAGTLIMPGAAELFAPFQLRDDQGHAHQS